MYVLNPVSEELLEGIMTSNFFLFFLFLPLFSFLFVFLFQYVFSKAALYTSAFYAYRRPQVRYYYHKFFNVFTTGVCVAAIFSSLVCGTLLLYTVLVYNPVYIISFPLGFSSWIF